MSRTKLSQRTCIRGLSALAVVSFFSLASVAEAGTLYSEDFEGVGTGLTSFGYTDSTAGSANPTVELSAETSSRVVKLGQSGGGTNGPLLRPHGASFVLNRVFTLSADSYIVSDADDQAFGLAPNGTIGPATAVSLYISSAGNWTLDSRGLTGGTIDTIAAITTGSSVPVSLVFDTYADTVTGNVGGSSFVKSIPNLGTLISPFGNVWVQSITSTPDILQLDNLLLSSSVTLPEPSTVVLLGVGLVGMASRRRRRLAS